MHRINHHIRMVLVFTVMAALAVCILTNSSLSQSKRRDKADKKTQPVSARDNSTSQPAAAPVRTLAPWALAGQTKPPDEKTRLEKSVKYEIYLRAGLVAYLDQKYDQAAEMFQAAKPFAPPRGFKVVSGHIPTGMERMISAAKTRRKLTPDEVLKGDEKTKLILQMADVYYEAKNYKKSAGLCALVLNNKKALITPHQQSWATNRSAHCKYHLEDSKGALRLFLLACERCPKADWADNALYMAGIITYDNGKNPEGAIRVFKRLYKQYPNSEEADRAAYYVGVAYEWNKQWDKAEKAYKLFLKNFPESDFAKLVEDYHLKEIEKGRKNQKEMRK